MTVRRGGEHRVHIEAVAVVATRHPELVRLIIEFYLDSCRLGVSERISHRLSCNREHLVDNMEVEARAASMAVYGERHRVTAVEVVREALDGRQQFGIAQMLRPEPRHSIAPFQNESVGHRERSLKRSPGLVIRGDLFRRDMKAQ